jgi:hypothetical protein
MFTSRFTCGNCGGIIDKTTSVCPHCGARLSGIKCQNCGFYGDASAFVGDHCPKCKAYVKVSSDVPNKPVVPPRPPIVWNAQMIMATVGIMILFGACLMSFIFIGDVINHRGYDGFLLGIGGVVLGLVLIGISLPALMKKAVKTGLELNKVEDEASGSTKLHLACSHGDLEQVRTLIAKGANVNGLNKNGVGGPNLKVFTEIASLLKSKGATTKKYTGELF